MYDLTGNCYYQRIFLIFKYLYQPISLEITKVKYANVLRIIVDDDISFWSAIRWKFSKPCSNFINPLGTLWRRSNIGLKKRAIFVSSQVPSHLNHAQFLTPTDQGYWLAVLRSFFANRHEERVYDHSSSVLHLGKIFIPLQKLWTIFLSSIFLWTIFECTIFETFKICTFLGIADLSPILFLVPRQFFQSFSYGQYLKILF